MAAREGVIKGEAAVKHPAAAQAAAEKWNRIAEIKPIDSPRLKALFGEAELYCVAVFNPRAALA